MGGFWNGLLFVIPWAFPGYAPGSTDPEWLAEARSGLAKLGS